MLPPYSSRSKSLPPSPSKSTPNSQAILPAATQLRAAPPAPAFPKSSQKSFPHPSHAPPAPTNPPQSTEHSRAPHKQPPPSAQPANQSHNRSTPSVSPPSQTDSRARKSFPRAAHSSFRTLTRQSPALRQFAQFALRPKSPRMPVTRYSAAGTPQQSPSLPPLALALRS